MRFLYWVLLLLPCFLFGLDYSDPVSWGAMPEPAKIEGVVAKPLDVFFVYPTVISDTDQREFNISDPNHKARALRSIKRCTAMFKPFANVYAPYYRQVSLLPAIAALTTDNSAVFSNAVSDVEAAFLYYMAHYNQGRPYVIFSHSQGSDLMLEVMRRNFNRPSIATNCVAAYTLGIGISGKWLAENKHLTFATGETDTGCIITWNTQLATGINPLFTAPGNLGINPLNWKRTAEPASADLNSVSVIWDDEGNIKTALLHDTGAILNPLNGALYVTPSNPKQYESDFFGPGVLHAADISLFYRNISENVKRRLKTFEERHAKPKSEPFQLLKRNK